MKWQTVSLNVLDFPMFNTRLSRLSIKRLPLLLQDIILNGICRAFSEGVQIGPSNLNGKGNGIVFSYFVKCITRGKYIYWGKYIYCKHNGHFTVVVETEKMRAQPAIKLSQSYHC